MSVIHSALLRNIPMPTYRSRTLSVTIARPWMEVYAYASDPRDMHHWAAGLGQDFAPDGDGWAFHDPAGHRIRLTFTPANTYGVLDHDVYTLTGVVHSAMRVMPNGDGAELTFLLLQLPGMTDGEFTRDAETVHKDLEALKQILEH
jgi:hypothetical protein